MKDYKLIMEDEFMKRIKHYCVDEDITIKELMLKAIEEYLDKQNDNDKATD